MSFIATVEEVSTAMQLIVAIGENGAKIVDFVEKSVKEVEELAKANIVDGSSKFDVVMDYVEAFVDVIGENFSALKDMIAALVDQLVALFNEVGLFTHSSSDSDGE